MHIFDPYELTGLKPNHLSFGGLDRGSEFHEDKDCIQNLLKSEETLIVPVWRSLNLFSKIGGKEEKPLPAFLTVDEASSLISISDNQVFLGRQKLAGKTVAYLAIDISELEKEEAEKRLVEWGSFKDLRNISPLIDGVDVQLTIQRSGSEHTAIISAIESDVSWDTGSRGLKPLSFQRVHTAASWGEATALSFREIKERGAGVFQFLGLLATGQLSPKQLGGPVAIARMAGSEASRGITSLLLFLTFLSVNLAILNFLPIPALDGGHMVFLSWEMLTGKPPNERLQMALTLVSVGCLLMLMLFVISNDIVRMFF